MAEQTEFQRLYTLHIHRSCEAAGITQEQLAKRLKKSRQALIGPCRVRAAVSWPFLQQFCETLSITDSERRTLENEWILERICGGKHGSSIEVILEALRAKCTPKEFEKHTSEMVRRYRADMESL